MTKNCWYTVNISTNDALSPEWEFPTVSNNRQIWNYNPDEILNAEWISKLMNVGLDIDEVLLFYCGPNFNPDVAHIDVKISKLEPCVFGLNWVISGGSDTSMLWYELPPHKQMYIMSTMAGTKYSAYTHTSLIECDSTIIKNELTLVNVGIPHRIRSYDNHRWCVSIRTKTEINSWNAIVEYFQNHNLLCDR